MRIALVTGGLAVAAAWAVRKAAKNRPYRRNNLLRRAGRASEARAAANGCEDTSIVYAPD